MKIQLALDDISIGKAHCLLKSLGDYIDIIELGTPLLMRHGADIITRFKEKYAEKEILADSKIVDAGQMEAEVFFEKGADIITVLGGCSDQTFIGAQQTTSNYSGKIMVDLIDVPNKVQRVKQLYKLGCQQICLHRPSDLTGKANRELVDRSLIDSNIKVAVAGGINPNNLLLILSYGVDILVIGSAITTSKDPVHTIKKINKIISAYQ